MNSSRPTSWRLSPLGELLLDLVLGGDAGMIGAEHPAGGTTGHPRTADDDVLDGVVERMAHVERAGDVRRRDGYREGTHAARDRGLLEVAAFRPRVKTTTSKIGVSTARFGS
jgi:hypothetical protein